MFWDDHNLYLPLRDGWKKQVFFFVVTKPHKTYGKLHGRTCGFLFFLRLSRQHLEGDDCGVEKKNSSPNSPKFEEVELVMQSLRATGTPRLLFFNQIILFTVEPVKHTGTIPFLSIMLHWKNDIAPIESLSFKYSHHVPLNHDGRKSNSLSV